MLLAATRLVGVGEAFIEPPQNLRADMLQHVDKSMGPTPGYKLHLHPTDLAYSASGMGWEPITQSRTY